MARLERLTVYPVKGLDGVDLETAEIIDGGTIAGDREFALFDANGDVVNGKRTKRVHRLETGYDPSASTLTVDAPDGTTHRFDLGDDPETAEAWFSGYFDADLSLERDGSLGFVDRRDMGPSVISTATIRTVASWFDELSVDGVRRRLRANVEVGGVEPFWEDRFVGERTPAFVIGSVRFEGVTPCGRCIVPQRDPDTGAQTDSFRERFVRNRENTFPSWANSGAFDHYYTVMVLTRVPATDRGRTLRVGDPIEIVAD
ncbi:MOSC domain-containing protein [Natrinema caseinilyticum]|uniref:MOSC domain-containing protein n=1 Tax=Natrinema caseinilyticum TaxID=2961570 RepID=UPI0020C289AE|nr:MOSC N-terminal beta barrel domain-containing protein [Natrinema caseinilyticum]